MPASSWPNTALRPGATVDIDSQVSGVGEPGGVGVGGKGGSTSVAPDHSDDSQSSGGAAYPSIHVVADNVAQCTQLDVCELEEQVIEENAENAVVSGANAGDGGLSGSENSAASSTEGFVQTNLKSWLL